MTTLVPDTSVLIVLACGHFLDPCFKLPFEVAVPDLLYTSSHSPQAEQIPLFGVLWVLDQLFDRHVIEAAAIGAGLETITAHPRCRLPPAEIKSRLARYRQDYL